VPQKLWTKFKENGQLVYNDVMEQSLKNQELTVHPKTNLTKEEWSTICHNMSCYAAWSVSKNKLQKGDLVIDVNKKGVEVKNRKVA
jgi:hypothetical protein